MSFIAGASSIFSAVGSAYSIYQQNKAINKQIDFNNQMLEAKDNLAKFAQNNNINRANNVMLSLNADIAESKRELDVQATKQISKIANKQGSGITAGASKARVIQTAYRDVAKATGQIDLKGDKAVEQVLEQVRGENEKLQLQKINDYNNTLIKNANLTGQMITGMNAMLMVGNSAMSGYSKGMQFDKSSTGLEKVNKDLGKNLTIQNLDNKTGQDFLQSFNSNQTQLTSSTGVGATF